MPDYARMCEWWRVRDVVRHILYGNELNLLTLPFTLARYGFSSDRSGKVNSIARAEGRSPALGHPRQIPEERTALRTRQRCAGLARRC